MFYDERSRAQETVEEKRSEKRQKGREEIKRAREEGKNLASNRLIGSNLARSNGGSQFHR